ncbi:hypothetical protein K2173_002040 [Erythroxylum novogranatense]|uniref:Protein pelota homolog n=1 Tax=Erythroxylum novogranatense TaxID=1862640 RepID=A0AAV8SQ50_9ROSI|nr:hypothetical protein K2173_002040 [Erythroxylum novogranatense]
MKLTEEQISPNQPGTVKIIPEEPDDLWLIHNLIKPRDVVAAETTRKVVQNTNSGNVKSCSRVRVILDVRVTAVDFTKDHSSSLRISGKNLTVNEHVAIGAFHTLEIEKNKQFLLRKEAWSVIDIEALHEGRDKASGAGLAVILLQEGFAQVYSVGRKEATLRAKVEGLSTNKKNNSTKIFETLFNTCVKNFDFTAISGMVIGSSDSMKDEFRSYLLSEARRLKLRSIENKKSTIILVTTSKTTTLKEVLHIEAVMHLIKDLKHVTEIRAFKEVTDRLLDDYARACYGPKHVEMAQELVAIDTLLITDELFRSNDNMSREKFEKLVRSVRETGGKAFIVSSKNVTGEQLSQLTGVAATLRFPLPNLDDMVLQ